MKTNLANFSKNYRRRNWGGLWTLDGHDLSDTEARIFVTKALKAGYRCDDDVPEDLVREWLGIKVKSEQEQQKEGK